MADITDFFNHQFTISRVVLTKDGQGGVVRDYQPLTTVSGFMDPMSARTLERIISQQQSTRALYKFFCLPTDIQRGDRVTVADPPPALETYVVGVVNPGLLNHHLECMVEERQVGDPGVI